MIDNKLMALHTAYLGKVLSTNGKTAKIQPLGKVKAYNEEARDQTPLSDVPILQSARYKLQTKTINYVSGVKTEKTDGKVTSVEPIMESMDVLSEVEIAAGDIVLCVCCDRDITEAKKGNNTTPALGHHSQSASVIVGVL